MTIREINETDLAVAFPLIRQLRPHIATLEEFTSRWRRLSNAGYKIIAVWDGEKPRALAGYQIQESLVHGKFLYVNDLVTDAADRSKGHGARLMDALKAEAQSQGCAKLVLDTGLDNALGHRFYYRQGLLAIALRFSIPTGIHAKT